MFFSPRATAQSPDVIHPDPTDTAYIHRIIFPTSGCVPLTVSFNDSVFTAGQDVKQRTWDFGDGILSPQAKPTHVYVEQGTYTVTLSITDLEGVERVYIFDSIIHAGLKPAVNFEVTPIDDCASSAFKFINRVKGDYTSLIWYFGDGDTSSRKAPVHFYLDTGWMSPMLWVNNNGCIDSLTKKSYVHVKPPIVKMRVDLNCDKPYERSFNAKYLGEQTFTWDFGDGTSTSTEKYPVHTYAAEGKYFVKLSATNNNCSYVDTLTITVVDYTSPFEVTTRGGTLCRGSNIEFTAKNTGFLSALYWDFGDGTRSEVGQSTVATHVYTSNGTYEPTLHAVDVNGCGRTIADPQQITILGPVAGFEMKPAICTNFPQQIIDATIYDAPAKAFYFDFGDGQTNTYQSMPINHVYQTAGIYNVFMKVLAENGCTDSVLKEGAVAVIDRPVAAFEASAETVCLNTSVSFFDQSEGQQLGRTWYFPDGSTTSEPGPQFNFTKTGSQKVKLVIGTEQGCMSMAEKIINVLPLPMVDAGEKVSICLGESARLNVSGANNYIWNYDPTLSCFDCADPVVKPEYTTIYKVTGTDANGCQNADSVRVSVNRPFALYLPDKDTLCFGRSKQIKAVGGDIFSWSPTIGLSNANIPNPVVSVTSSTTYTLVAKDTSNCFSDTAELFMLVAANPKVNIIDSDVTINASNRYTIQTDYSSDIVKWQWDPPTNLSCSDCPFPQTTPDQIITYSVTATNNYGCSSTDKITIRGLCSNETIFIPNTFSPNGDNHNDYFYPRGSGLYTIKSMRIFNRWGQTVFERTNFPANDVSRGWNGKLKNVKQPSGVYIYFLEVICNNGTVMTFKGDVTLL